MRKIWFISDTHFGHKNIIKFTWQEGKKLVRPHPVAGRAFESVEEHDEFLIARWNEVVAPHDKVYHLGDFCMNPKRVAEFRARLNGNLRLILGNHDNAKPEVYAENFGKVLSSREMEGVLFTHIPVHEGQLQRWKGNVHGHLHQNVIPSPRYKNICVEHTEGYPVELDQILYWARNLEEHGEDNQEQLPW